MVVIMFRLERTRYFEGTSDLCESWFEVIEITLIQWQDSESGQLEVDVQKGFEGQST